MTEEMTQNQATGGNERGPAAKVPGNPEAMSNGAPTVDAESSGRSLEFLSGVELEGAVEIGRVKFPLGEVLKLTPGAVLQLDKMVGDPVELRIKERRIANGEVVVVDDRFGVRITEIAAVESPESN
jgi:flagellar motor switch protein FliN/FliY